jgi:hypothetical protein
MAQKKTSPRTSSPSTASSTRSRSSLVSLAESHTCRDCEVGVVLCILIARTRCLKQGWEHPGGDQIKLFGGNDVSVQVWNGT